MEGRSVLTRSIRVAEEGRTIDILDDRRRRAYSVRLRENVVILSSHPSGRGAAFDLGSSGCETTRYGERTWIYPTPKGATLIGQGGFALRLEFDQDCVTLVAPRGAQLGRFVRNLQLRIVGGERGVSRYRSLHTNYGNPVHSTQESCGITMSGAVVFPIHGAPDVDYALLARIAAIGVVAEEVGNTAVLGSTFVRDPFNEGLSAALGDAAVITAVLGAISRVRVCLRERDSVRSG